MLGLVVFLELLEVPLSWPKTAMARNGPLGLQALQAAPTALRQTPLQGDSESDLEQTQRVVGKRRRR